MPLTCATASTGCAAATKLALPHEEGEAELFLANFFNRPAMEGEEGRSASGHPRQLQDHQLQHQPERQKDQGGSSMTMAPWGSPFTRGRSGSNAWDFEEGKALHCRTEALWVLIIAGYFPIRKVLVSRR